MEGRNLLFGDRLKRLEAFEKLKLGSSYLPPRRGILISEEEEVDQLESDSVSVEISVPPSILNCRTLNFTSLEELEAARFDYFIFQSTSIVRHTFFFTAVRIFNFCCCYFYCCLSKDC